MKTSIALAAAAALTLKSANADSCFATSQGYQCCSGCNVYYTDADGAWGFENNEWCGIPDSCSGQSGSCWSLPDFPCCSTTTDVVFSDSDGDWGFENNNWCGIEKSEESTCWSLPDYECCPSGTEMAFEDATGKWGVVNDEWCGIISGNTSTTTKNTTTPSTTTVSTSVTTTDPYYNKDRKQSPYPDAKDACGSWALVDNVCCAQYCSNIPSSEGCGSCGGNDSEFCTPVDSFCCKSGARGYDFYDIPNDFHYSRSTHFGLTFGGACGFGLYQVCGSEHRYTGEFATLCDAFCKAYPTLCQDPSDYTFRGNFAAPQGNYYTQFWGSLIGDQDNYLSCGECFEVYKVKEDGSDYQVGEAGYQPPVVLQVIDSCPCSANGKWCCGSGWDHCDEVNHFKYGCPIPQDSIHLDLSDIAMARLQEGNANGFMEAGVIPNKYRRVPCPHLGNMYIWLRPDAGPYWFAFTVVNAAGFGAMAVVEAKDNTGKWVKFIRDPNYTMARPQERYGVWCTPRGEGPFDLPIDLRFTDGSGAVLVAEKAIKSFDPPADSIKGYYYIDLGVNFPEIPMPDPE